MNLDLIQYNGISHMDEENFVDLATYEGQMKFRKHMKMLKFCQRMERGEID